MTYRVEFTARAKRDLRRLYLHIDAANSEAALRWFAGLEAAVLSLDENPARSSVTPENSGLRHLLYSSKSAVYRVIYSIDEHKHVVTVIHIRHGSRNLIASLTSKTR